MRGLKLFWLGHLRSVFVRTARETWVVIRRDGKDIIMVPLLSVSI